MAILRWIGILPRIDSTTCMRRKSRLAIMDRIDRINMLNYSDRRHILPITIRQAALGRMGRLPRRSRISWANRGNCHDRAPRGPIPHTMTRMRGPP